ncbi:MAG: peptidylprolyl isomerase [Gemmatimonadota bacterium]|nr:peptidylprolyl isomerase [Gemmatimonadota bacterium]
MTDVDEGSRPYIRQELARSCARSRLPIAATAVLAAAQLIACDAGGPDYSMLLTPDSLTATAPDVFQARFETTKGDFVIEVHREWSPNGADRFYNLVVNGFYDDVRFFRVIAGFVAQFGIHGDPEVSAAWRGKTIADDPVTQSNTRGFVTYAMGGPDTRTTQIFINYGDNSRLDEMGFSPFGQVIEGMEVADAIYSGYGDFQPRGNAPDGASMQTRGNEYLRADYPNLDFVRRARIVQE